ncbi:hypothetical protein AGMMS50229_13490 [Campylobacterota bacterium]|nr:hypothetical protein AGMMS50229_13490 [Campylobacterota bacterium]
MIENSVYGEVERRMLEDAEKLAVDWHALLPQYTIDYLENGGWKRHFFETEEGGVSGYHLVYPLENGAVMLTLEIGYERAMLDNVKQVVIIANFISLIFIPLIAQLYSYFLAQPINRLGKELSLMDEHTLSEVDTAHLPSEFVPLGKTLNRLLILIHTHISYQRQLFIGLAHELKTPLAVIRARNDVTLLKEREPERYKETIRQTNDTIGEMNKMTRTILEFGHAEYAQFDHSELLDIVNRLRLKCADFELLAKEQNRELVKAIEPQSLLIHTRPTLISHIVQNLFSNALKYTPKNGKITIASRAENQKFIIEVIDEGDGIGTDFDPFAPFVGKGELRGSGLGLFLAKNAAIALGGTLKITNREDAKGAIATFTMDISPAD